MLTASFARSLFLFRGMDDGEISHILLSIGEDGFRREEFSAGECISRGGEICCMISGSADIRLSANSDAILRRVNAGDSFGAGMIYTDDFFSPTVAVARTKSVVLFIPKETVDRIIMISPKISTNYISFLSGKIAFLNRRILSFAAGDAEAKLAVYLYQISGEGRALEFTLEDSYTAAAKKLNMGRASLYRVLDTFENRGIISRDGSRISILKFDELLKIIKK